MAGLVVSLRPAEGLSWWGAALLIFAVLGFTVLVLLEFRDSRGLSVFVKDDAAGIKEYMHRWIKYGGRVAVWTRDMTWAQSDDTRQLLLEKAQKHELIICVPELNDFTRDLIAAGADVSAYGSDRLESPASRFTIAFFGRDGSRVAVGRAEGDFHAIAEFGSHDHPAFHLATDLIALARSLAPKP
jgi:hypothetical protein